MELQETGFPEYWVKKSIPHAQKCFKKTNQRKIAIRKPISLDDLAGAFLILGVGVSLAIFFFLLENIIRFQSRDPAIETQWNLMTIILSKIFSPYILGTLSLKF